VYVAGSFSRCEVFLKADTTNMSKSTYPDAVVLLIRDEMNSELFVPSTTNPEAGRASLPRSASERARGPCAVGIQTTDLQS